MPVWLHETVFLILILFCIFACIFPPIILFLSLFLLLNSVCLFFHLLSDTFFVIWRNVSDFISFSISDLNTDVTRTWKQNVRPVAPEVELDRRQDIFFSSWDLRNHMKVHKGENA